MSDAIKDSEGEWTVRRFGKVVAKIEPNDWTIREARAHAALEAEMLQEGSYVKDLESLERAERRHEALSIRLRR